MKVGIWLETQNIKIEDFEPPAANGRIGDYRIKKGSRIAFVEVKTLFGEKQTLTQDRFTSDLAQYCTDRQLPVESLNLENWPENYDYIGEKDILFANIEGLIRSQLPLMKKQTVQYEDKDGISIEISLSPKVSRVVSRMYGGFSDIGNVLRSRVGAQNSTFALKPQVSQDNIPTVLIINDFNSNIDRTVVEDALYGTLVHDDTREAKTPRFRKNDGRWSSVVPSDLNAVFVLRFKPISVKMDTVDAYLCPNPKYIFETSMFSIPNLLWRRLNASSVDVEESG